MPVETPVFALNHMCAPETSISDFLDLAKALGVAGVEIRNDIEGNAILDGTPSAVIRQEAQERRLRILSINALQRFNDWTQDREAEAKELIAYAKACGAEALVLVPVNDGSGRANASARKPESVFGKHDASIQKPTASLCVQEDARRCNGERQANLRIALKALQPLLEAAGITGLVEPLGFEQCSLRLKSEAVDVITSLGAEQTFRLVHDTFHHHLAGEAETFPQHTGLVHISGVSDPGISVHDMRDGHRVLVDPQDRLGNAVQIAELMSGGYRGVFSFEPFADSVHRLADLRAALSDSMAHLVDRMHQMAA